MTTFFEWLFGIEKSPEQLKKEIEESNEENYRHHTRLVMKEASEYKQKYKEILEYRLGKPVESITIKELVETGFHSNHITKKFCKEGLE